MEPRIALILSPTKGTLGFFVSAGTDEERRDCMELGDKVFRLLAPVTGGTVPEAESVKEGREE